MWELDHKEEWVLKNWCFQTVVLEKTPESPLNSKEMKPVNPKGDQPWIFTAMADSEAEAPPDVKSWLIGKNPDAGKDWGQEEKQVTKDEIVDDIIDSMDVSLNKLWEMVKDKQVWHASVHKITNGWIQ